MTRRLLKMLVPVWPHMAAAVLLGVLTIAGNVGLMGLSAYLIASAALHPSVAVLSTAIVGVRFFGLARGVLRYLERYVAHSVTFRLLGILRVRLYQAVERLAPAGLAGYKSGDLLARMASDIDTLQFFYLKAVAPPLVSIAVLLAVAGWLYRYDALVAAVFAGGFAVAGMVVPAVIHTLAGQDDRAVLQGKLNALLVDSVQGMTELTAFAQTGRQEALIAAAGERLLAAQSRQARLMALADALSGLTVQGTVLLVLLTVIPLVRRGSVSGVEMAVIALAVQSSFEGILPLAAVSEYLRESRQAGRRIFSIIDAAAGAGSAGALTAPPAPACIEFANVCFSYDGKTPVLSDVSFRLKAGTKLAVVGASGAGKTSIVEVLQRFWDIQSGSIRLDGRDIGTFTPESLRRLFAVVPQHPYLFNASVRDNILLARPDASPAELEQAIACAGLERSVKQFPRGLDTPVGQNGHALSGGQRQRIAIARAILKGAPVLILDEPYTGLDPVSERDVSALIARAAAGRTMLLITHRLLGLEATDEIIVMAEGRIAERGTLDQLLAARGEFYRLWIMQNSGNG